MKHIKLVIFYLTTLSICSCSFVSNEHFLYECRVLSNELSEEQIEILGEEINSLGALTYDQSSERIDELGYSTGVSTDNADNNATQLYSLWVSLIDPNSLETIDNGTTFEYSLVRYVPSSDPNARTGTVTVTTTHFEKMIKQ